MSSPDRLTLRYMLGFRCIAGSCRENCCTGLRVELSEQNHRKLAERSAKIPGLQVLFEKHLELEPEATRTAKRYAHIEPHGSSCPYLDGDWLCAIHRHAGEETLADPCSLFPRVIAEVNGRFELSATLACPEAARLCLTSENAVDSVPYEPSMVAREIVVRRHETGSTDPYVALLDDVRQICLDVMDLEGVSTTSKLLLLLDFALRVEPHFHRGTTTFDVAAFGQSVDAIGARLSVMEALPERKPSMRAVKALHEMLLARLSGCDNKRFNALFRPLLLTDRTLERGNIGSYFQGNTIVAKDVSALVRTGSDTVHGRFGVLLDRYLQRAAVNSFVKDWYTQQPTLAGSLRRLIVRLALSRFALFVHPGVTEATDAAALDELAVDSFQIIAKNVEHVPAFMELCEAYLAEQQLTTVEGAALLLSV
jgi:lysine-N-methylase